MLREEKTGEVDPTGSSEREEDLCGEMGRSYLCLYHQLAAKYERQLVMSSFPHVVTGKVFDVFILESGRKDRSYCFGFVRFGDREVALRQFLLSLEFFWGKGGWQSRSTPLDGLRGDMSKLTQI